MSSLSNGPKALYHDHMNKYSMTINLNCYNSVAIQIGFCMCVCVCVCEFYYIFRLPCIITLALNCILYIIIFCIIAEEEKLEFNENASTISSPFLHLFFFIAFLNKSVVTVSANCHTLNVAPQVF